jgi:hypothetical protein
MVGLFILNKKRAIAFEKFIYFKIKTVAGIEIGRVRNAYSLRNWCHALFFYIKFRLISSVGKNAGLATSSRQLFTHTEANVLDASSGSFSSSNMLSQSPSHIPIEM